MIHEDMAQDQSVLFKYLQRLIYFRDFFHVDW